MFRVLTTRPPAKSLISYLLFTVPACLFSTIYPSSIHLPCYSQGNFFINANMIMVWNYSIVLQCSGYKSQTSAHKIKVSLRIWFQSTSQFFTFTLTIFSDLRFFFHSAHHILNSHSSVQIQLKCCLHCRKPSLTCKIEKGLGMKENEIRCLFPWHFPGLVALV